MTGTPVDDSRYFQGIKACVFDAYGTIFDLISATDRRSAELGDQAGPLGDIWRSKQLQYTWLRSLTGHYTSFWQVTQDALDYAMAQLGLDDPTLRDHLLAGYKELKAYDDVAPVLDRLQKAGMGTAILSNGSRDMLEPVVENAGLSPWLDVVLSVEDSQIFKPDYRVYQQACDYFELPPEAICFLSSNGWDAAGAASFGFHVAWINRGDLPVDRLPGQPAAIIKSMSDLPALLKLA
jgi:2-haloalkanoic acid dehalogenase, type II